MKKYGYMFENNVTKNKDKHQVWQQIYDDYHSGVPMRFEQARNNAVAEMTPYVIGMVEKHMAEIRPLLKHRGDKQGSIEDLYQSMFETVVNKLSTYVPVFEGRKTLGSSYMHNSLLGCIYDYIGGGDGDGTAPESPYMRRHHGSTQVNSLEEIAENPKTTFVIPSTKSAENVFMEKYHQKIYDDFMCFISGYSSEEKKKAALLFARIRLTADEYEYLVRILRNAEKRHGEERT